MIYPLSAARFTWTGTHGCADASDFLREFHQRAPEWFELVSPRTQQHRTFFQTGLSLGCEGEIISWDYTSALASFPGAAQLTLSIVND